MTSSGANTSERLFSYGTLQLVVVQRQTFGRQLEGSADQLVGYSQTMLQITDPAVLATSGKTHHPMVASTGNPADRVDGTVFAITHAELMHADAYEVADYRRDSVLLASGARAWVYVDARSPVSPAS